MPASVRVPTTVISATTVWKRPKSATPRWRVTIAIPSRANSVDVP